MWEHVIWLLLSGGICRCVYVADFSWYVAGLLRLLCLLQVYPICINILFMFFCTFFVWRGTISTISVYLFCKLTFHRALCTLLQFMLSYGKLHCNLPLWNTRQSSCVLGWSGVWPLRGWEWVGFFLWMGFQKDVKKLIREYGLVVVYVVIGDVFCVCVESFRRVKVWSFSVVS